MHIVLHAERFCDGLPTKGIKWEAVLRTESAMISSKSKLEGPPWPFRRTLTSDNLAQRLETFDIRRLRRPWKAIHLRRESFKVLERPLGGRNRCAGFPTWQGTSMSLDSATFSAPISGLLL